MTGGLKLLTLNLDAIDTILMRRDVRLQQRMFLLQVLHASQVLGCGFTVWRMVEALYMNAGGRVEGL